MKEKADMKIAESVILKDLDGDYVMPKEDYEWALRYEMLSLCSFVSSVFGASVETFDLKEFVYAFLQSDTFPACFTNLTIFSQSKYYALEILEDDSSFTCLTPKREPCVWDKEVAEWIGYLFAFWYQEYDLNPKSVSKETIEWLYDSYDVLHTQDVKYCYELYEERIEERESCLKEE